MNQLEQRLEALTNRKGLQEVGVVRPYPTEWDLVPYPPKFKAPTLQAFDGKGSPNQHIYYFKSQIGNVVDNDAILARLFIGTLKGLAFEWFMKLLEGSIKNWGDLEKLFQRASLKTTQRSPCLLFWPPSSERESPSNHL